MNSIMNELRASTKKHSRKGLYNFLNQTVAPFLANAQEQQVLNVGSGGMVAKTLANLTDRYDARCVSVDIDPLRGPDVVADVAALPFKAAAFDCVMCVEVLEHVWEPHRAASELHRILATSGLLVVTTRFIFPLHDAPFDYFRYTKYALRRLFGQFKQVELITQHDWFETIAVLLFRLIREKLAWVRLLSIPLYVAGITLNLMSSLSRDIFSSDYITTGYFLRAVK